MLKRGLSFDRSKIDKVARHFSGREEEKKEGTDYKNLPDADEKIAKIDNELKEMNDALKLAKKKKKDATPIVLQVEKLQRQRNEALL